MFNFTNYSDLDAFYMIDYIYSRKCASFVYCESEKW